MTRNRTIFTPKAGQKYLNDNGTVYTCLRSWPGDLPGEAIMQSPGGWTFTAHSCGLYDDGTMDWDYSTGGSFEEVRM